MQHMNALRGYSDFFQSGFRVFTNRGPTTSHDLDAIPDTPSESSTLQTTFPDHTVKHRLRSMSMFVQNTPHERARRRPTSFLSFESSEWCDQRSTTPSFDDTPTISSSSSIFSVDSEDSLPEAWTTAEGLYTFPSVNDSESSDRIFYQSVDPFSSAPDAKSIFLDFSQAGDNEDSHHSCAQQEKPDLSIRDKEEDDDFFLLSDWDAPAKTVDWRQFHVDILTDSM